MGNATLLRSLFLASVWTLVGGISLGDAAPPYTTTELVIALLTLPGLIATVGLLLVFCVQPAWDGKEED